MSLSVAGSAEIIRANQKDEFYISRLRTNLADILQKISGAHTWLSWRSELDLLADFTYFCLTTLAGYQSLGEEYVNVVQVDHTKRAVPSKLRHISMIFLHVCGWYGLRKLLDICEKKLRSGRVSRFSCHQRELLLNWIPTIRQTIILIGRCHLAVFYLQGVYYHLAKRLLGVQYLQVSSMSFANRPSFRVLGWLSLSQICASLTLETVYFAQRHLQKRGNQQKIEEELSSDESTVEATYVPGWKRCSLCLEERKDGTATPCGHLFCWNCIHEWCKTKAECPLCRVQFSPSRLIFLQNYN